MGGDPIRFASNDRFKTSGGIFDPTVQQSEVGGGPATGLGGDLVGNLQAFMRGDPVGRTGSIFDVLSRLVAGQDTSGEERSLESIIQSDIGRGSADIRERFGAGGQGTPAAVAESLFRSEAVPRGALAVGQLRRQSQAQQLQAILPILQMLSFLGGKGISQREAQTIVGDSPFSQGSGAVAGILQGIGEIVPG